MVQFDHPVVDLPSEYYPAVGEFLFRFSQLEYQMHEVVWLAMEVGYQRGRILTIGTGFRAVCGMIGVITHPGSDTWIKDRGLIQEMNSIALNGLKKMPLRNRIAHGSWQSPDGRPGQARLHFMKEKDERILPHIDRKLDYARIHKHTGELRNLNYRAKKLLAALLAASPTPPPQSA